MKYFKPHEFREWYGYMNPSLLAKLDLFRELWEAPVTISPHPDSLGRLLSPTMLTRHNVNRYRTVDAVDVFPKGMDTKEDMERAFKCAKQAGFKGIGLYTDTNPSNMMHLDVRDCDDLATWVRVKGKYKGISEVIDVS